MSTPALAALDSFDATERRDALSGLATAQEGAAAPTGNVNMHMHSFFSYNSEDYSPSHVAWACRQGGLHASGLCDFDVLDGLDEFLAAGRSLGLRTTVNLETRAFFAEYADVDINSPGEPGVTYIMGAGFTSLPAAGTPQAEMLGHLRSTARERNVGLIDRVNHQLREIAVNYESDVVPLTPGGCPTERHIVRSYIERSTALLADSRRVAEFWSRVLELPADDVGGLLGTPGMDEKVRARLAKRGGLGYEQPTSATFPPVDDFLKWVQSCGAIPMITWLDGTSGGELDPWTMCEGMMSKGAAELNIVPDRNWNLSGDDRDLKRQKLREIVAVAEELHLPVNIGTEMNKAGLPFVDNLSGEILAQYKEIFVRGANIMVGHSLLAQFAGLSYCSAKAAAEFSGLASRNEFFAAVGGLRPVDEACSSTLVDLGPEKAYAWFQDQVAACA